MASGLENKHLLCLMAIPRRPGRLVQPGSRLCCDGKAGTREGRVARLEEGGAKGYRLGFDLALIHAALGDF